MVLDVVRIADGAMGRGELTLAGNRLVVAAVVPELDFAEGTFIDSFYKVWPLPTVSLASPAPAPTTRPVVTMPATPRGRLLLPPR